jgi:hypothetical protein
MPQGTRVDTPLGRGTVMYRRMKPPNFTEIDAVSVSLDKESGRWGRHKGAMFNVKDVTLAVDPGMDGIEVAKVITQQIGNRAFGMLGAKDLLGDENSLTFRIGRNAQGVTHIRVQLDPSDTYTMQFLKVRRLKAPPYIERKVVSEVDDVYAEDLRRIIEMKTGMYTSL